MQLMCPINCLTLERNMLTTNIKKHAAYTYIHNLFNKVPSLSLKNRLEVAEGHLVWYEFICSFVSSIIRNEHWFARGRRQQKHTHANISLWFYIEDMQIIYLLRSFGNAPLLVTKNDMCKINPLWMKHFNHFCFTEAFIWHLKPNALTHISNTELQVN